MTSIPSAVTPSRPRVRRSDRRESSRAATGSPLPVEAVADALHGDDPARGRAQLFPEASDVDVDRPGLDLGRVRIAPDGVQELLPAQHAPGGPEESGEERELLG